jgi:hypothetical protein
MRSLSPSRLALPLLLASLAACDGFWELAGAPTRPPRSDDRTTGEADAAAPRDAATERDAAAPRDAATERDAAAPRDAASAPRDGAATADVGPSPTPPTTPTCASPDFACIDSDRLSWCDAGARVTSGCDAICAAQGYPRANGCGTSSDLGGDSCFCLETACDAGPATCTADGRGVASCRGGAPVITACEATCAAQGLGRALGCSPGGPDGAACLCDAPAPPPACTDNALACIDGGTLAQCERGRWEAYDCARLCGDAGFDVVLGCGPDGGSGLEACLCDVTPTCPRGQTACDDGTCIDEVWVCDGRVDCASREDEAGCAPTCLEGDSVCVDAWTIDSCNDGAWETWDCGEVCWQAGYEATTGCDLDPSSVIAVDACFCTDL